MTPREPLHGDIYPHSIDNFQFHRDCFAQNIHTLRNNLDEEFRRVSIDVQRELLTTMNQEEFKAKVDEKLKLFDKILNMP